MKSNKGFSLVELIVVMAIMAVATSVTGFALSYIYNTHAKACAENINSALENTRTVAMSKDYSDTTITIRMDDNIVYLTKNWDGTEEEIGSGVTVQYSTDGSSFTDLDSTGITIGFNRSSGAFSGTYPKTITVTGGGRTYTVTCYGLTGKSKVE